MKLLLLILILLVSGAAIVAVQTPSSTAEWETDPEPPRRVYPESEDPRIETVDKRSHRYADQHTYAQLEAMKSRAWDQMTTARLSGDRAGLTRWNDEYNAVKGAMAIQVQRQKERDDLDARLRREAARR